MINKLIFSVMLACTMASQLPDGFDYLQNIDPTIIISPRYAQDMNFVGQVIDGYLAKTVIITKQAGIQLSKVQKALKQYGYSLVVYDAYRPQKAVDNFMRWCDDPVDSPTKSIFYPNIAKKDIIPGGYIAKKSGHTRGSTVDLTIIKEGQSLHVFHIFETTLTNGDKILYLDDGTEFMGSHFDFFGPSSYQDTDLVSKECLEKRNLLRKTMLDNGFRQLHEEWWHYTLVNEPFSDTYFDFDII